MSTAPTPTPAASSGMADNTAGMVAYITIIPAIIFLVMEPYNKNKFVRFHAFQSLFFGIACIGIDIVLMIIPFIGWLLIPFVGLGWLIVSVLMALKANKGEKLKLPLIGDFAEKQANS